MSWYIFVFYHWQVIFFTFFGFLQTLLWLFQIWVTLESSENLLQKYTKMLCHCVPLHFRSAEGRTFNIGNKSKIKQMGPN